MKTILIRLNIIIVIIIHTLVIINRLYVGLNEGFERWEFECGEHNHDDIILNESDLHFVW
jgi:hypothetical protein